MPSAIFRYTLNIILKKKAFLTLTLLIIFNYIVTSFQFLSFKISHQNLLWQRMEITSGVQELNNNIYYNFMTGKRRRRFIISFFKIFSTITYPPSLPPSSSVFSTAYCLLSRLDKAHAYINILMMSLTLPHRSQISD